MEGNPKKTEKNIKTNELLLAAASLIAAPVGYIMFIFTTDKDEKKADFYLRLGSVVPAFYIYERYVGYLMNKCQNYFLLKDSLSSDFLMLAAVLFIGTWVTNIRVLNAILIITLLLVIIF